MKKSEIVHVDILTRCPACGGEGRYYRPSCVLCYTYFSEDQMDEWLASNSQVLPCGCDAKYLFEKEECDTCCGVGTVHHPYSPDRAMKTLRELQDG
jgi:hypothetical protein